MTDAAPPRFGLVLDCADPQRLAEFWAHALDYVNVGSAGSYVALYPREGNGPKLLLQRVDEPKQSKNRMHLDIETPDIHAEAARLTVEGQSWSQITRVYERWLMRAAGLDPAPVLFSPLPLPSLPASA